MKMETAEDLAQCSICKQLFSDPRMLPCIHNFCLRCLQQSASQVMKGPGDKMSCPCCGKEFTVPPGGMAGLQRSLFIDDLVKEMKAAKNRGTQCDAYLAKGRDLCLNPATMYCSECRQRLCKTCSEHHRKQKVSKKHHIMKLVFNLDEQTSSSDYCSIHYRHLLSIYCSECSFIICDECCRQTHATHTCTPIGETIENSKKQVTTDLEMLASHANASSARREQLETIRAECLNRFVDVEAQVIERGRKLKELVDAHVGSLLSQLVLMKTKRIYEIDSHIDEIKTCLELTESFGKGCSDMSLKTSSLEICCEATALNKKAIQIQKLYNASHLKEIYSTNVTLATSQAEERLLQMGNIVGEIREELKPVARDTGTSTTHFSSAIASVPLVPDETTSKVVEGDLKPAMIQHIQAAFDPSCICLSKKLDLDANVFGITKLSQRIYILVRNPNAIRVLLDQNPFTSTTQIQIHDIKKPHDMASTEKQNCLYVTDSEVNCVWQIASDATVTKWLSNIGDPFTLFITPDSRLVMARRGKPSRIEIYKEDASLDCLIQLPINIEEPLHAVENSDRNCVVSHKWREQGARETVWSISVVNNRGEILHRLCTNDKNIQCLKEPQYLSVDPKDQVLVADFGNGRVVLLNSDLGWDRSLETEDKAAIMYPKRLYLDNERRQLLVGQYLKKGVHVYTF